MKDIGIDIGIIGIGVYIPEGRMSAKDIATETGGVWSEDAIKTKLGIHQKSIPSIYDGTQEMAVKAGLLALEDANLDPLKIDVVLCMGEEWKEYPLTTSALYIQEQIGARNAWGIDVQNRCCTTVSALKIAKDMLIADKDIHYIMVVGGYRNGDFIDYTDKDMSMMYNLSAGAGALILQKDAKVNRLLGSHIIADGAFARDAGVLYGGINQPITVENLPKAYQSLQLFRPHEMKDRLNEVSFNNWMTCIHKAIEKSDLTMEQINYVAILHIKRSMHEYMLEQLGVTKDQSIYLEDYGHMGQVDQILSLKLGLEQGKINDGDVVLMIAAGIGYVWAAHVIQWGGK